MPKADPNKNYLNNPNLKKANVQMQFTAEQVSELIKCKDDPLYFIQNYVKIVHVDDGVVKFNLWPFQERLVNLLHNNRFVIGKVPRQSGKTITVVSYILHQILFNSDFAVAILANKLSTARQILGRLQKSYENLPLWMQQGLIEWNKGSIALENGSSVIAASTAATAVRGNTYNLVLLDEFAFVQRNIAEEFFTSVYPTISSGKTTKVFIISTPKGMNYFYKLWTEAATNRSKYVTFEAQWQDVPTRDKAWYDTTLANIGAEKFAQEFGCDFLGSSDTLIQSTKIKELAAIPYVDKYNDIEIWEAPIPEHFYVISVDVARGQGRDNSAFSIIDATSTPYKVVGRYKSAEVSPMLFPDIILHAALKFNNAHVLIEINDIGGQVADALYEELEYENVFTTTTVGRGGQKLSAGFKKNCRLGVKTTQVLKSVGCSNLKDLIEKNALVLYDFDTIMELTCFVATGTSYAAEQGGTDDLVMTLVLFAWATTQQLFKDLTNLNIRQQLYAQRAAAMNEDLLPKPLINNGLDDPDEPDVFQTNDGDVWVTDEMREDRDFWDIRKDFKNPR